MPAGQTPPLIIRYNASTVPILPGDDEATLSARILEQEHLAYPEAVQMVVSGSCEVRGRCVLVRSQDSKA